ncbi:MAG: hypothetical protein ACFB10_22130 [Salibacteraceae bacterium]
MRCTQFIVAFILAMAVLSAHWGASLIQVDYLVNIERIIEQFCVNKDKPMTTCNGQCHLAKQLKKHEEKRKEAQPNEQEEQFNLQWWVPVSNQTHPRVTIALLQQAFQNPSLCSGFPKTLDRPPGIS